MNVTIVGAGVVGLTTARHCVDAGYNVRVVADRPGVRATSGVAGAVWFPYLAEPWERLRTWGRITYRWLADLAANTPEAGVLGLPLTYVAADDDARPAWADALPEEVELRFLKSTEVPAALWGQENPSWRPPRATWAFPAPVVDPARHLAWLIENLPTPIVERHVTSLDDEPGDVVINCTGPRAGALTKDPALRPTFGQVVIVSARDPNPPVLADDRDETAPYYIIPRGHEVVLGGINQTPSGAPRVWEVADRPKPRQGVTEVILARAAAAGFEVSEVLQSVAGWRPIRSAIRVQRAGRIVHHYGHGGSGFTLAYGSAQSVAELLRGPPLSTT